MKYSRLVFVVAVSALFLLVGSARSSDQSHLSTVKRNSSKVYAYGIDVTKELSSVLVGSGIEGISSASPALTLSGGTIHWVNIRDRIDVRGMRHAFYRQHYVPPVGFLSDDASAAASGVWMAGAELGLHIDAEGQLRFVFGTQFEDVDLTNIPLIGTATEARQEAHAAALDLPGFSPQYLGASGNRVEKGYD